MTKDSLVAFVSMWSKLNKQTFKITDTVEQLKPFDSELAELFVKYEESRKSIVLANNNIIDYCKKRLENK